MKIYIASSKEHVGNIREDIDIRNAYISCGITSKIATIKDITKIAEPFDMVVLKSIWGYHTNYLEFISQLKKLEKKSIVLINDYNFVIWNIYKHKYLNEIGFANIVPTNNLPLKHFRTTCEIAATISNISKNLHTSILVIKPSVSASGYLTYLYDTNKNNNSILTSLWNNRHLDFIIQPYRSSIVEGEISVIIIDGRLLYGVIRFPGILTKKDDIEFIELSRIPNDIKKRSILLKKFFLKKFGAIPSICRVDFLRNNTLYEILEVELIDPDLFFRHIPSDIKKRAISAFCRFPKKYNK